MPWRVIARVGLSRDGKGSTMRKKIADILVDGGFTLTKTGTWETVPSVNRVKAAATLRDLLDICSRAHENNTDRKSIMRYLWLYVDYEPPPIKLRVKKPAKKVG